MPDRIRIYDVIVVGAGPAGVAAAIYAERLGLKVLVLKSGVVLSQLLIAHSVENYPGFPKGIRGSSLISLFTSQAEILGVVFETAHVTKIKSVEEKLGSYYEIVSEKNNFYSHTVILATGASYKRLGIEQEDIFVGKGLSYCALCDGAFFKDKEIVLVGGGDTALEEALYLANIVKKVTIVHRRGMFRAVEYFQRKVFENKKIEVKFDCVLEKLNGRDFLESVTIRNNQDGVVTELPCAGLFIAIGFIPNTGFLKGFVDLDKGGFVKVDLSMKTSRQGVFSCGDCTNTTLNQVVTAAAEGAVATTAVKVYMDSIRGLEYF
ncbi:MAG: FAD-dependent oxidoreductase [Candidatus Omnitrophota bacterium]